MSRIAVIIPAHQAAGTIGETLKTLFAQTHQPDEVVVVDDGSTDNLVVALQPWSTRVRYIHQAQQGAPVARNTGFAATTADFVLFLDADIRLRPTMLEKMFLMLTSHPEASFVYSDFQFGWKTFHLFPYSVERLRHMNYIHTSSLLRRSDFPGFDPSLRRFQDWDIWLTIAERGGSGVWIDEVLYQVRQQKQGMSAWVPKVVYRLPWIGQGAWNKNIAGYRQAEQIIRQKHHLT